MIEVRTTAHADVLAVVDRLAGLSVDDRSRPPAPARPRFQQGHPDVPLRQRRGGGEPGQSAADDDDVWLHRFEIPA